MDDNSKNFRCYSVRRLNPFLGVVQIVETADSRAITPDGVDWEIQILTERPHDTWSAPSAIKQKRQFLRFGVWNSADGLCRVPANPLLDLAKMIKEANRIIEILLPESVRIPFPLQDKYELWLLDEKEQTPFALLASTTGKLATSSFTIDRWVCANQEFPSIHMDRRGKTETEPVTPNPNKSYLEKVVKQRAGRGIQRWFKRSVDGSGRPLSADVADKSTAQERPLPAQAFPPLLLLNSWNDSFSESVISDYHYWLSPYLLTLQNLPDDLRHRLERKAAAQAVAVNACWRLYPKIIDRKIIDTARVEARLRQSQRG